MGGEHPGHQQQHVQLHQDQGPGLGFRVLGFGVWELGFEFWGFGGRGAQAGGRQPEILSAPLHRKAMPPHAVSPSSFNHILVTPRTERYHSAVVCSAFRQLRSRVQSSAACKALQRIMLRPRSRLQPSTLIPTNPKP